MIKDVNISDILSGEASKAAKSGESNNDLISALLKNKKGENPLDFANKLSEQIENVEENAVEMIESFVDKQLSKGKKGKASSLEIDQLINKEANPKLDKLIAGKDSEVKNVYNRAKDKNAALDDILGKLKRGHKSKTDQEIPTQNKQQFHHSIESVLNKSKGNIHPKRNFDTRQSLTDVVKGSENQGETFYKNAPTYETKSLFNMDKKRVKAGESQAEVKNYSDLFKNSQKLNNKLGQSAYLQQKPLKDNMFKNNFSELNTTFEQEGLPFEAMRSQNQSISHLNVNPSFQMNNQVQDVIAPQAMDFSSIRMGDQSEVISQVTDYLVQRAHEARPNLELNVNHAELGKIQIYVEKNAEGSLNVAINAPSVQGREFFSQNQGELFSSLNRAGLGVTDLKIDSSSSSSSFSKDGNSGEFSNQQFSSQQWSSQDGQRRQESQKRQEMWSYYSQDEQEVA
jgi:hypothetical protein